jgi:hypothetical protein
LLERYQGAGRQGGHRRPSGTNVGESIFRDGQPNA